jgi:DNA-binding MarR family transcriptional regulator
MTPTENDTGNHFHRSVLKLLRVLRIARSPNSLATSKLLILGHLHSRRLATATELAAYLRVRPQSLTRQIADLERLTYITRRPNGTDPRQNDVQITKDGEKALLDHLQDQRSRFTRAIEKELTPAEQAVLKIAAGLIDRISRALEEPDQS